MDTIRGFFRAIYELLRLGVLSRFRMRSPYWTWRMQTAFGRGMPGSKRELIRGVLGYGLWAGRMRQLGRLR